MTAPSEQMKQTARRIWEIALDSWALNVELTKDEVVVYQSAWEKEFIERVEAELSALVKTTTMEAADASTK